LSEEEKLRLKEEAALRNCCKSGLLMDFQNGIQGISRQIIPKFI
jgi:hypothetical protein